MSVTRRGLLLGTAAGLSLTACGGSGDQPPAKISAPDDGYHGTALTDGYPMPTAQLTNQDGQPWSLATSPSTPVVALFFGYSNCPDVCPGILADMATARRRLAPELAEKVGLVMVSTDPARDTPAALKDYLRRIDESFVGLTGDLAQIIRIGNSMGVAIEKGKQLPSGGYEVDHGTHIMGVGADRRVQVIWTDGYSVGDLREDYERLIAAQD